MIKIIDDILLANKTANDLILCKKTESLFINGDFLNVYAALVKAQYPYHLKRGPYLVGKKLGLEIRTFLDNLPKEYRRKDFLKLRKCLEEYTGIKRFDITLPFWMKKNYFPFVFLRVISLLKPKNEQNKYFAHLIGLADHFTSFNHTLFRPPLTLNDLLNDSIVYFVGVAFGDGGVADNFKLFKITDGAMRKEELKYTRIFFKRVSKLLKGKFGITSKVFKDFEDDNKYRIQLLNKWFNYYMNFFFGMPLGPKKNVLRKPLIINLSEERTDLSKVFWRGVFDTDGCLYNTISLEMANKNFIMECKKDLENYGMRPHYTERNKIVSEKHYREFCITINRCDHEKFAENIGFCHPRKQRSFTKILLRKATGQTSQQERIKKLKAIWSSAISY